jgi:hypothetical protein
MSNIREFLESRIKALKENVERHKQHLKLIKRLPDTDPTARINRPPPLNPLKCEFIGSALLVGDLFDRFKE